jgi:hypothetical protein
MFAETGMSTVYNPEADVIADIERLELEGRDIRRKLDHVRTQEDRRALNKLLAEIKDRIEFLRRSLP